MLRSFVSLSYFSFLFFFLSNIYPLDSIWSIIVSTLDNDVLRVKALFRILEIAIILQFENSKDGREKKKKKKYQVVLEKYKKYFFDSIYIYM